MRRWIPLLTVVLLPALARGQGRTSGDTQSQEALAKADAAFVAKRFQEAIGHYNTALSYDRTLLTAYEKLAQAYFVTKGYAEAATKLRACLQVQASHTPCLMWLGLHLVMQKQMDEGIRTLQAAVKAEWKLPLAQWQLGIHYFGKGEYEKAESAFWVFLRNRSADYAVLDLRVQFLLGQTYLRLRKFDAAQTQFGTVLKSKPGNTLAKLGLAEASLGRGQFSAALTLYQGLLSLAPKKPDIYLAVARCQFALRQKQPALDAIKKYLALRSRDIAAVMLEGDVYFSFKDFGPALASYQRATTLAPQSTEAKVKYAEALLERNQLDRALDVLQQARRLQPRDPTVLLALGRAQIALKKPQDALRTLDELVRNLPRSAPARQVRGEAHLLSGAVEAAIGDFRKALELDAKEWKAKRGLVVGLNRRARERLQKGEPAAAIADLKEAFTLEPTRLFTKLNLGIAHLVAQQHKEAMGYLSEVYQKLPTNFSVNRVLGRAYFEAGNLSAARGHYERARGMASRMTSSFQAEVEAEYGALLAALGQIDGAVTVLKSAVSNSTGNETLSAVTQANLAIALLDRGYQLLEKGKGPEALADLEEAKTHVKRLQGNQPQLLEFLLAMAYLENGKWAQAADSFKKLGGQQMLAQVLKPPFDRLGAAYFQAYTLYRQGGYEAAAAEMRRLLRTAPGEVKMRIRDIIRSAHEMDGTQAVRRGDHGAAKRAFGAAKTYVLSKPAQHNLAVAQYQSGGAREALATWQSGGMPATSLCNVGTHFDNAGEPQRAYEFYTRCKAAGGSNADVEKRIETIKRLFGY